MPYATEIAAIVGVVCGVLTGIFIARLTHFGKDIAEQETKMTKWREDIIKALQKEAKRKKIDSTEELVHIANSLSAADAMKKRLDELSAAMGRKGFVLDFICIGLLISIAILGLLLTTFNEIVGYYITIVAIVVGVNFYAFVATYLELEGIKKKIKAGTESR